MFKPITIGTFPIFQTGQAQVNLPTNLNSAVYAAGSKMHVYLPSASPHDSINTLNISNNTGTFNLTNGSYLAIGVACPLNWTTDYYQVTVSGSATLQRNSTLLRGQITPFIGISDNTTLVSNTAAPENPVTTYCILPCQLGSLTFPSCSVSQSVVIEREAANDGKFLIAGYRILQTESGSISADLTASLTLQKYVSEIPTFEARR